MSLGFEWAAHAQVMQEDVPDEDAENAGKGGCGLGGNLDVAICRADWHLHRGEFQVGLSVHSITTLAAGNIGR